MFGGQRGFSVMELIVVMGISGILLASATMQYSDVVASFNRQNGLNALEFDLRRARSEAIASGTRGVLKLDTGGGGYSFGLDLTPYNDPVNFDSQSFRRTLPSNVSVTGSTIVIDSRGFVIDSTTSSPTSASFTVQYNGVNFCTIGLTPIGTISISCT